METMKTCTKCKVEKELINLVNTSKYDFETK